ncbi:YeeE/YedE family protein [Phytobacter diazotrophicus]|uniref:YeeE/YedE family protein n=1 Tax=Phytobacter diazotrophicus TaxID=395631 RepID=UPI00232CAD9E|nr:YeeE/YedE family protein [Phytobacter diazotrophicus]MDC0728477.1 YeeE/YedE family protein [Phytobacter diazotrophicus]MDC0735674.1 YeeE/YedE family protein [Phytobacter diazotrophicus]
MMIDWTHFTPLESAIGGVVIGAAASMLILFCGRVAGISGILGGVLSRANNDKGWRIAFLLGLVLSPVLWRLVAPLPAVSITASWPMLVVAGLLVGVGTRYGSGCTSGHGVCGLSRLSVRSLIATLTFMAAAFITVWLVGFWRG